MSAMGINPVDLPVNPVYHNITGMCALMYDGVCNI
jgi:hypothetical protein